ncbi:solute carrier family 23 protein [Methanoregula sp.]|uniref:uracil-xanthine permease family protein n=1 Tax=Methanoregula sp. TaxID=2052170 RepID=UPI002373C216|nr:solute carrier family 23 protein [Methanoregula sp.]MDD1687688.1 purine/pyrimidine permease [Methanoregula sp.]
MRPPDLEYAADDKVPLPTVFLLGLQHTGIVATAFIFPILVARAAGIEAGAAAFFVSMSMLANGISTICQAIKYPEFGSGYLIPRVAGPNYVSASVLALQSGGLALLCGMTAFSGALQAALSRVVHRLRVLFPVEVTGLVIMMLGVAVVPYALPNFFGMEGTTGTPSMTATAIAVITLAVTVGITVWGRGQLKLFPVIVGMAVGYALCIVVGLAGADPLGRIMASPLVALPDVRYFGLSFDPILIIPFGIAGIVTFVKSVGEFSICQRINDTEWKRPDMMNIRSGLFADGIASFFGGLFGGMGQTGSSSNIGLSIATRATSRYIGYMTGALLILLAFLPFLATVFIIMPGPVIGGTLIYVAGFIIVGGFQTITTRMLDSRKIFVIGISFIFGISVYLIPNAYAGVPALIRPLFDSALSLTTVIAIVLNLVMRIGIRKKVSLALDRSSSISEQVFALMERQGEAWAARREVIQRMAMALTEACELVTDQVSVSGPVTVAVSFDEYNLDAEISYAGAPLPLPETRPGEEEILSDPSAMLRLGGFLIRGHADRVCTVASGGLSVLKIHMEH